MSIAIERWAAVTLSTLDRADAVNAVIVGPYTRRRMMTRWWLCPTVHDQPGAVAVDGGPGVTGFVVSAERVAGVLQQLLDSSVDLCTGVGWVSVRDRCTDRMPAPAPRPDGLRGGLTIVDALAGAWGTSRHDDGKTVWAVAASAAHDRPGEEKERQ